MRTRYGAACALAMLVAAIVGAADAPIRLPNAPTPPVPQPVPGAAVKLVGDVWYVIDSKVECSVRGYPAGLVSVGAKKGPRDISAVFVDGNGVPEDRSYDGPFIYVVRAAGVGECTLVITPLGLKSDADILTARLAVNSGKAPQPPPDDGKTDPAPKQVIAWAIVVEETSQRTADTAKVLGDLAYWQSLKAKGVDWRFYDKDSPDAKLRNFDTFGAEVGLPAVLFLAADGKKVGGFKLPKTTAEIDAKMKEIGK